MVLSLVFVLAGLLLLMGGGDILVRGSVALANRFGLSKALIGATFVAFGTSMPEFVASFGAAARWRLWLDFFFVMLASSVCLFIIMVGSIPVWLVGALVAIFIIYMAQLFR